MNKLHWVWASAFAGLLACSNALAADNGFYLGGAIGQTKADVQAGNINFDDKDNGYKLFAGFRPLDLLGAELNYIDFGTAQQAAVSSDHDAYAAFLIGYLPLPFVDLYGKLGAARWNSDTQTAAGSSDDSGTDLAYGVGVQLRFGSLSTRLEYEAFQLSGSDEMQLLSLGIAWTFL